LHACLNEEPGAEVVEKALAAGTAIGTVNWAEVLSKVDGFQFPYDAVHVDFLLKAG
jgi:PIN domain nuclease of toxin-antitoxin system